MRLFAVLLLLVNYKALWKNCGDDWLRHVCFTVRMEQLGFHWIDFHEM
jgi:hypothetical protein